MVVIRVMVVVGVSSAVVIWGTPLQVQAEENRAKGAVVPTWVKAAGV